MAWVLLGTLVGSKFAVADVLPPEVADCQSYSLDAGNPCTLGKSTGSGSTKPGTCVASTCTKLDYAHWDQDASPGGPPTMTYSCLTCVAGAAIDSGSSDGIPGDGAPADATGADHTAVDSSAVDAPIDAPVDAGKPEVDAALRVDLGGQAGTSGTAGVSGQAGASGATATTIAGGTSGTYTTGNKSNDGGGCAVGRDSARALGPWLLAGVFGLLVSLIRRRR